MSTYEPPFEFEAHPDSYRHWKLEIDGDVARLWMNVQEDAVDDEDADYARKLNSYDIHVDIELADAVQRLRFEHPEVRTVVVSSAVDRVFCSGANIFMLGSSTHAFKVNFCKFTNETRLYIEDASANSGQKYLAALNGACAGGGYELALACDDIVLIDDRSSSVSLPETPLLAVLPGTGGLTRVVDKRFVRPDLADALCTIAEGVKGKRAKKWGLVDEVAPRSKFQDVVTTRARALVDAQEARGEAGVVLDALKPSYEDNAIQYRHVRLEWDNAAHTATLQVTVPDAGGPTELPAIREQGADWWVFRLWREVDNALLNMRFHLPEVNVVQLKTRGNAEHVLAADSVLVDHAGDWFISQVGHHVRRVLKRLDYTAKSFLAIIDQGSCFAGQFFELALASDRSFMLDDPEAGVAVQVGATNRALFPMGNGLTRLQRRFLANADHVEEVLGTDGPLDAEQALDLGLVTFAPDDLDWDDEVRITIEERAALSPDALTGMESNLRFAGPETLETKIFGRLSAWQNWIFQRPNAVGKTGALTLYGRPERPQFDMRRT